MDEPDKNASTQPLPGSVSDQNQEEAEPGHDAAPGSGTGDRPDRGSGGESGEGSQSTGNPDSAG
ncbi:MAG TPA: hypothetical protein VGH45_13285 [Solirubrobacteraceae bacterium]|jgi:hypothetical protein